MVKASGTDKFSDYDGFTGQIFDTHLQIMRGVPDNKDYCRVSERYDAIFPTSATNLADMNIMTYPSEAITTWTQYSELSEDQKATATSMLKSFK